MRKEHLLHASQVRIIEDNFIQFVAVLRGQKPREKSRCWRTWRPSWRATTSGTNPNPSSSCRRKIALKWFSFWVSSVPGTQNVSGLSLTELLKYQLPPSRNVILLTVCMEVEALVMSETSKHLRCLFSTKVITNIQRYQDFSSLLHRLLHKRRSTISPLTDKTLQFHKQFLSFSIHSHQMGLHWGR